MLEHLTAGNLVWLIERLSQWLSWFWRAKPYSWFGRLSYDDI